MEVELSAAVFSTPAREDLAILALLHFGLVGRHRVVAADREACRSWIQTLPLSVADEVELALDEGERLQATGPGIERVTVVPAAASSAPFVSSPLRLSPRDAISLLGRPLRVLLENGRNDRNFILAFSDRQGRSILLKAESEGWLVFETAGGIGELVKRLAHSDSMEPREALRLLIICDSDAKEPATPSENAKLISSHLSKLEHRLGRQANTLGRVLRRRAAENYSPPSAVLDWACENFGRKAAAPIISQAESLDGRTALTNQTGKKDSSRRRLFAAIAFKRLPETARSHLDMKEGRGATAERTADSIWNQLDDFQKAALLDGFGSSFSADFFGNRENLTDETGEISGLISTIMERL